VSPWRVAGAVAAVVLLTVALFCAYMAWHVGVHGG
jgi:hypothetical protein